MTIPEIWAGIKIYIIIKPLWEKIMSFFKTKPKAEAPEEINQEKISISLRSGTDVVYLNCNNESPSVNMILQIINHTEDFYCHEVTSTLNVEGVVINANKKTRLDVSAHTTTEGMLLSAKISGDDLKKLKKIIQKAIEKDGNYAMQNINYSLEIEADCKSAGKDFVIHKNIQSAKNLYFMNLNSLLNTAF